VARRGWPGDERLLGNVRHPATGAAVSFAVAVGPPASVAIAVTCTDAPPAPVAFSLAVRVGVGIAACIPVAIPIGVGPPAPVPLGVSFTVGTSAPAGACVSAGIPFHAGSSVGRLVSVSIAVADGATVPSSSLVRDGIPDAHRGGFADAIRAAPGACPSPDRVATTSADA
jgi:hypothetical protein